MGGFSGLPPPLTVKKTHIPEQNSFLSLMTGNLTTVPFQQTDFGSFIDGATPVPRSISDANSF
jgi:hypothetical protein